MQKSSVTKQAVISATLLNRRSGEVLKRVGVLGEHLIVEQGNFQVAAIIPIHDYQRLLKGGSVEGMSESEEVGA